MSFADVRKSIVTWWHTTISPMTETVGAQKNMRELMITVIVGLVIVGSFWGYRYYTAHQEGAAQIALAQGIQAYNEAARGGSIRFPQVELLLQNGYEQHKKSSLAGYFLVYKADTQVKLGKLFEAVTSMAAALELLPKDSPFTNVYQLKFALMRMDLPDEVAQRAGLESLRTLAYDKANINNDAALYYLGLHAWDANDRDKAVTIWKELVAGAQSKERLGDSPWAQLAQEKLAAAGQQQS